MYNINIFEDYFQWDDRKAITNFEKHGVSFESSLRVWLRTERKRAIGGENMRDEYDFTQAKKNPYAEKLRKTVTINLDVLVIDYFKAEAQRTGVPYQTLINLYLTDCVRSEKHLAFV